MDDLRKRFGQCVAMHRRRKGLTQDGLAEAAELSVDMVSKIETGGTGARFPAIERLAAALEVDPGELFQPPGGVSSKHDGPLMQIASNLAKLPDADLRWVKNLLEAALRPRQ